MFIKFYWILEKIYQRNIYCLISPLASSQNGILWLFVPPIVTSKKMNIQQQKKIKLKICHHVGWIKWKYYHENIFTRATNCKGRK